jgi:hypothetical protein
LSSLGGFLRCPKCPTSKYKRLNLKHRTSQIWALKCYLYACRVWLLTKNVPQCLRNALQSIYLLFRLQFIIKGNRKSTHSCRETKWVLRKGLFVKTIIILLCAWSTKMSVYPFSSPTDYKAIYRLGVGPSSDTFFISTLLTNSEFMFRNVSHSP